MQLGYYTTVRINTCCYTQNIYESYEHNFEQKKLETIMYTIWFNLYKVQTQVNLRFNGVSREVASN